MTKIVSLRVDSPLFSTIVLLKTGRFPGFPEVLGSLERMGKVALEFQNHACRVSQFCLPGTLERVYGREVHGLTPVKKSSGSPGCSCKSSAEPSLQNEGLTGHAGLAWAVVLLSVPIQPYCRAWRTACPGIPLALRCTQARL